MKKLGLLFLSILIALSVTGCSSQEEAKTYEKKVTQLEEENKQLKLQNNQLRVQNEQMKKQTQRLSEQLRARSNQPRKTVPSTNTEDTKKEDNNG